MLEGYHISVEPDNTFAVKKLEVGNYFFYCSSIGIESVEKIKAKGGALHSITGYRFHRIKVLSPVKIRLRFAVKGYVILSEIDRNTNRIMQSVVIKNLTGYNWIDSASLTVHPNIKIRPSNHLDGIIQSYCFLLAPIRKGANSSYTCEIDLYASSLIDGSSLLFTPKGMNFTA